MKKDEVLKLYDNHNKFLTLIGDYIAKRASIDPDWKSAKTFDVLSDKIYFDEGLSGLIGIEWEDWENDTGYCRKFPASDLWDPNVVERINKEVQHKQELISNIENKRSDEIEKYERSQLAFLRKKYGE